MWIVKFGRANSIKIKVIGTHGIKVLYFDE